MRAAGLLLFFTLLNVLAFADRYMIQSFAVDMIADLQLSNVQFTLLTGFLFTLFYMAMALVTGAMADRYHRPRLIAAGLLLWSVLTAATGAARSFTQAAFARALVGVGEATLTPAALSMLSDVFSERRRALAAGIYFLGIPVGIGGAFLIAGTLGAQVGWRSCFYVLGALGVLLSLLVLLLRDPRSPVGGVRPAHPPFAHGFRELRGVLARTPALVLTILGGVLIVLGQGALVLDQVWLVEERGFDKVRAQQVVGVLFLLGGVMGSVLGGMAADAFEARRRGGRLYFLALAYCIAIPVGLLYRFEDPAGAAFYVYLFVGSVALTLVFGPLYAAVQDLAPAHLRSTTIGLTIFSVTLFGVGPGNLLAGWLADTFKAAAVDEPLTWALLYGGAPGLLAIPCFFVAARLAQRASA